MRKYIIIVLIILGALHLGMNNPFTFEKSGHGLKEIEVTGNKIYVLEQPEFDKMHKKLYPKDRYVAVQYTIIDQVESIELYIGDQRAYAMLEPTNNSGTLYILIKENNDVTIMHSDIEIVDKYNFSEVTSSSNRNIGDLFPEDKEYGYESWGAIHGEQDIVFNEKNILYSLTRGYGDEGSNNVNYYTEIDASISIVFNRK